MAQIVIPVGAEELLKEEDIAYSYDNEPTIERSVQGAKKEGPFWHGRVKVGKGWHVVTGFPSIVRSGEPPEQWHIADAEDFIHSLKG